MMYVKSKDSLESSYTWQRRRVIYHHHPPPPPLPPLPATVLLSSGEEGEKEAGGGAVLDAVKSKLLEEGHLALVEVKLRSVSLSSIFPFSAFPGFRPAFAQLSPSFLPLQYQKLDGGRG